MSQFSRHTIAEYLPVVKSICASLEVEMARHDLNTILTLHLPPIRERYGNSTIAYALMLIGDWLKDTPFSTNMYMLQKASREDQWEDMVKILNTKIQEYQNDVPIIVLALSRSGHITRTIDGTILEHEFESDKFKKSILFMLHEHDGYIRTRDIQKRLGSKSTESVSKAIAGINVALRAKLQLSKTESVIESKRASGYRLNPLYNLVVTS